MNTKTSRRTFIKTSTLAVAGSAVLPELILGCGRQKAIIGLQLYSIRDEMGQDPLGSLKQVATMGYKYVEHADYIDRKFYGYSPADFRKVLDLATEIGGTKVYIIEQESYQGKAPMECVKKDLEIMKEWGY